MGRLSLALAILSLSFGARSTAAQDATGPAEQHSDQTAIGDDDLYLWLEEVDGRKAMEWVDEHNVATLETLGEHPAYDSIFAQSLRILSSDERIAYAGIRGDYLQNFWKDDEHVRGIWRRTSWESYLGAIRSGTS